MRTQRVRLARPLEKTIAAGHPWIYRDALEAFHATPGDELVVETRNGRFLARGLAESGPIAVRVLSLVDRPIDAALVGDRLDAALDLRDALALPGTNALRLVHGEGDRLPGVVVDRYDATAVLRLDGDAATAREALFVAAIEPRLRERGIGTLIVRTGRKETISVRVAFGNEPPRRTPITEHGMTLLVDLMHGQKTGLFLDHRESRRRVRELARGRRVLNLYGYTGGFSIAAGLGGASSVTTVDIARAAIELAGESWAANGLDPTLHHGVADDVPTFLAGSEANRFDLIVADPPNFAPSERSLDAALASYRKLHADCLGRLSRGGFYLAASCSSHVDATTFLGTIREAAASIRKQVQVLERTSAPADHPRLVAFPEGDYLKVVLLRVLD